MATLTIRGIDDTLYRKLKAEAAMEGVSLKVLCLRRLQFFPIEPPLEAEIKKLTDDIALAAKVSDMRPVASTVNPHCPHGLLYHPGCNSPKGE